MRPSFSTGPTSPILISFKIRLTDMSKFLAACSIDFSASSATIWQRLIPGKLTGTPKYMAPELIRTKHQSASADLYALGVICYEVIAGKAPFDGQSGDEIIANHLNQRPPPLRYSRDERSEEMLVPVPDPPLKSMTSDFARSMMLSMLSCTLWMKHAEACGYS